MRIFKTKIFHRWAKKLSLGDEALRNAIAELNQNQYEASLGGYLYKKRIALNSRGKSAGVRTIIAFKLDDKAFFVYGFAKNQQENMSFKEMLAYQKLARILLFKNENQLQLAILHKTILEI
jgi:hypothetical protein